MDNYNTVKYITRGILFGLLLSSACATAQSLPEEYVGGWQVASFSGRVTKECLNRSTMEMKPDGNEQIWAGEKITTMENGQVRLEGPDKSQIRMREKAKVRRADMGAWEVETGLAGFRFEANASETPANLLITPLARVECKSGIVIVKVAPYLTRIAVLKGTAEVVGQGGTKRTLSAKQECAAVPDAISSVYDATDDLYFAWYWDKP